MKKVTNYVFVRHRHNWLQLFRFGLVGGSGVLVNMVVTIVMRKLLPHYDGIAVPLPVTEFNIRWYHVIITIAFLVANLWNFQLNRTWTFRTAKHAAWWREYFPFLATGLVAYFASMGIVTLLLKDGSPIALPREFFDDSTGFRTRLYWANLIAIVVTMPLNFVVNKLWTFRAVRGRRRHPRPTQEGLPMVASAVAPEMVDEDGNPRSGEKSRQD